MILEAFVDDTGTDGEGPVCAIAGFVSSSENWEKFSDAWADECSKHPATPDFKMATANRLKGEYWGYLTDRELSESELCRRRDSRVNALVAIIERWAMFPIWSVLKMDDYNTLVKGRIAEIYDSPYFFNFQHLLIGLARRFHDAGVTDKIQFVFDDQSLVGNVAASWHPNVIDSAKITSHLLARTPAFARDCDVLPLKAADMLAWHIRRDMSGIAEPRRDPAERFSEMPKLGGMLSPELLQMMVDAFISTGHGRGRDG